MDAINPLSAKDTVAFRNRFSTVKALRDERTAAVGIAKSEAYSAQERLDAAIQDLELTEAEFKILESRMQKYGLSEESKEPETLGEPDSK